MKQSSNFFYLISFNTYFDLMMTNNIECMSCFNFADRHSNPVWSFKSSPFSTTCLYQLNIEVHMKNYFSVFDAPKILTYLVVINDCEAIVQDSLSHCHALLQFLVEFEDFLVAIYLCSADFCTIIETVVAVRETSRPKIARSLRTDVAPPPPTFFYSVFLRNKNTLFQNGKRQIVL